MVPSTASKISYSLRAIPAFTRSTLMLLLNVLGGITRGFHVSDCRMSPLHSLTNRSYSVTWRCCLVALNITLRLYSSGLYDTLMPNFLNSSRILSIELASPDKFCSFKYSGVERLIPIDYLVYYDA